MWHFISLTDDEVAARRVILDKYGSIAQASAVLVILAVGAYQWLSPMLFKSDRRGRYQSVNPSGVELRSQPSGATDADEADEVEGLVVHDGAADGNEAGLPKSEETAAPQTGFSAWLDTPLRKGWRETRRHALAIGLWALWIFSLAFPETGDDYLHLTKRFAQLGASLLPFHYLLGTPSRLSPLPRLFRVSASGAYNAFHRFHALLIFALLGSHASFYLNFYLLSGLLPGRLAGLDVMMGLTMLTTLIVLAVLARQTVRYNHRPVFVASHIAGAGLICVCLFVHAPPARWYAVEAGVVYLGVLYERLRRRAEGSG